MRQFNHGARVRSLAWVLLAATVTSFVLTWLVRAFALRLRRRDRPADARAHTVLTPRLGGIAIALTWTVTVAWVARYGDDPLRQALGVLPLVPIVAGALLVFVIGLADDLHPVPAGVKVGVEALAIGALLGAGIVISHVTVFGVTMALGWLSVVMTMAWMIAVTNAFNLLDGLDGLATGLAIIAGLTCALIVIVRGDAATAVLLVALVGSLVGFLPFNFNPASIFLGDSGSLFIGFVLGLTAITGFQKEATALAAGVPLLIFGLPLLDTVITIVRRLRVGPLARHRDLRAVVSRLLQPDREHIHHQLMSLGLSHRAAVLVLYAVAAAFSGIALLTFAR